MAPRQSPRVTPKVQRTLVKNVDAKNKPLVSTLKKTMSRPNVTEKKVPLKVTNATTEQRQRTNTVPKVATPKPKENKSVPLPGSVTKSAKKASWKRRPKPAHSGVPIPDKMKRLLEKQLQDSDCSL